MLEINIQPMRFHCHCQNNSLAKLQMQIQQLRVNIHSAVKLNCVTVDQAKVKKLGTLTKYDMSTATYITAQNILKIQHDYCNRT
jgi:hypothetical protein